jgi:glycosyltransferase involved in cell wall biosynthesis
MMPPKISIITPCFNRAEFIAEAVESVLSQSYNAFEHIIIDGGSTDRTLELLSSYSHLRTFSELDHGMYDALNKGLAIAQGGIIGLLNTDDVYEADIFGHIAETFDAHPEVDVMIGKAVVFEDAVCQFLEECPRLNTETLPHQLLLGVPAINAWFFRRAVFERVGMFDQTYGIGADRDFLIRLYLAGFNPLFMDRIYYRYRKHSGSLTINSEISAKVRVLNENLRLARKYINISQHDSAFWQKCVDWHDLTSIELLILLLRQKQIGDSFQIIRSAIEYNPKWLWLVAVQSPARIKNYIKKSYDSKR